MVLLPPSLSAGITDVCCCTWPENYFEHVLFFFLNSIRELVMVLLVSGVVIELTVMVVVLPR